MHNDGCFTIDIDEHITTEVRVEKSLELTIDDVLDKMDTCHISELLVPLIRGHIDDLYLAVHGNSKTDIEYYFRKIYEELDLNPPLVSTRTA